MVTSTENKIRPKNPAEPELGSTSWNKPATATRSQDVDNKQTGFNFVYVIVALAVLGGGYLLYTYEGPTTTTTPAVTNTDVTPPVTAPAAPAASSTVTPPAIAPVTPPATTTTP
ncbi:MAG: hypothetical protein ABJA10_09990 [Aestuariivirga sp.]